MGTPIRCAWTLAALLAAGCGGGGGSASGSSSGNTGTGTGTGTGTAKTLLAWRGVSLAGADFGETSLPGTYGTDYAYPDPASAAYFQAKGMDLVRLPFRWERLQRSLGGALDATELARLKSVVDGVTTLGLTVLLDPHNYARYDGALVGSAAVPDAALADFWTRLAAEFKDNPRVMFGLMNEPHDMATEDWVAAANAAIAAIRATGAINTITVPGNAWTGAASWSDTWYGTANAVAMLQVADSAGKLLFEVHQYLDADSSGTSATCVSATIGSQRLAGFTAWLRANGRRGFLGEIGAGSNTTCNLAVADALDHLAANADVWAGFSWWAAGPRWGDYFMSIEPGSDGSDKPQMAVLAPYLKS